MLRGTTIALACAALLLAAGCHQAAHIAPSRPGWQPPLAPIEPTGIVVSVGDVARYNPGDIRYVELTAAECQCLAASNSKLGNLLAAERRAIAQEKAGPIRSRINAVKREILLAAEMEARNASAAGALQAYYGLAEAEARYDLAGESLAEVDDTIGKLEQMRRQGLQLPIDDTQLVRQRHEVQIGRLELEATINELNHQLRTLLAIDSVEGQPRIWPTDELAVVDLHLDPAAEVSVAMATRPELVTLRRFAGALDSQTAAAIGPLLSSINPLLGSGGSSHGVLKLLKMMHGNEAEAAQRARQLVDYQRQREREVASEVELAVATVQARATQAALAQEKMMSWEQRLEEVEKTRATGQTTFADVSQARLKLLESQGELVAQAAAWKRAVVDLKKAQGVLVDECRALLPSHCQCCLGHCCCSMSGTSQLAALHSSVATKPAEMETKVAEIVATQPDDGSAALEPVVDEPRMDDQEPLQWRPHEGVVKLASRGGRGQEATQAGPHDNESAILIAAEPDAAGETATLRLVAAELPEPESDENDVLLPKAEAKRATKPARAEVPAAASSAGPLFGPPPLPPFVREAR